MDFFMRIIKLNIIILFAFLIGGLSASGKDYEWIENNEYVFKYLPSDNTDYEINNFFIREIARYNLTGLYNTHFTMHYAIHKKIKHISSNTFYVEVELQSELLTGNTTYKKFDISDILMPEKLDLVINVEKNGNYIVSKELVGISWNEDHVFHVEFTFEELDEDQDFALILEDIHFYSENADKNAFINRQNDIDNYYASIDAIDFALDRYNPGNIEINSIVTSFIRIKELERVHQNLSHSEFIESLSLSKNDPAGFFDQLNKLEKEIIKYNYQFDALLQSLDFINLNKNIKKYANTYVDEITSFYMESQTVTHSNTSHFYKLGSLDYQNSYLANYSQGLEKFLRKTQYCNDISKVEYNIKKRIFEAYQQKALKLIEEESYYLAKGILINAQSFYKTCFRKSTPVDLNILISKANYGIYHSFLHLIDRAIEVGNYKLAESYIKKAQIFQGENSITIISDKYLLDISEELARLYISKGTQLIDNEEYEEAIYCFNQAHKICLDINRFNFDYEIKHGLIQAQNGLYKSLIKSAQQSLADGDVLAAKKYLTDAKSLHNENRSVISMSSQIETIDAQVKFYSYQNLNQQGRYYLEAGNYSIAYSKFLAAFELEEDANFEYDQELPALFHRSAIPVLVDLCSLGEVKVNKNQLNEARNIYDQCFQLQDEYGLNYVPEVQKSLALLNNNIFNKQCENSYDDFDNIMSQFYNYINQGDYITAIETLDKTSDVINKDYYCDFDRELVLENKKKYSRAAEYQILAKVAQEALNDNDHEKFIETQRRMEDLSGSDEVIRKKIEPLPLYYLFSIKKNLALLESSINDYKDAEEFETAFKLLRVLQANNYSDKETKSLQQKLANKMAMADKQNGQQSDPKLNAEKYTDGNQYLKHFKKSYIKHWE